MTDHRPDRTTMEGMIWNANHVLETALKPDINGIPIILFNGVKGIVLISVVEAGFIFSGSVGTGIVLAKKGDGWSPPSAVGLTGVGWGFLAGGSVRDLIVFLYDDDVLASATSDGGLKLGGQAELSFPNTGRAGQVNTNVSNKGFGATVAVAFSKGAFLALSVEGAIIGARHAANQAFYGEPISPPDIVLHGKVQLPDKVSLIHDVYDKLDKLAEGKFANPTPEDEEKKSLAKSAADAAAVQANQAEDVVQVDASEEAAKESS